MRLNTEQQELLFRMTMVCVIVSYMSTVTALRVAISDVRKRFSIFPGIALGHTCISGCASKYMRACVICLRVKLSSSS
ncbi:hypothetical protein Plhal304r1_c018g0064401 [Plasmopara halstedii]